MSSIRDKTRQVMLLPTFALALGCVENTVLAPAPVPSSIAATHIVLDLSGDATVDSVAKGLALALQDENLRTQLRDDLRDSPFRNHALHLPSYLRGARGRELAKRAAATLGITLGDFHRISSADENLELVLPRLLDRVYWDGSANIDVVATNTTVTQARDQRRVVENGYDLAGNVVTRSMIQYSRRPYLLVRRGDRFYPFDTEALRTAAPRKDRATVSTPTEERARLRSRGRENVAREAALSLNTASGIFATSFLTTVSTSSTVQDPDCPPFSVIECLDEGSGGTGPEGVGGGGATLPPQMTLEYCFGVSSSLNASNDTDSDGILDACELEIASQFAPLLNLGQDDERQARQSYWSMSRHPDRPDQVQIIYAIGYVMDGGHFNFNWEWHEGDSEFIILEVANPSLGSLWGIKYATLSAHFGTGQFDYTSTYYHDDLQYPGGAYPRIWASLNKHANYRSKEVCAYGGYWTDSCAGNYSGTRISSSASRNLGNYYHRPPATRSTLTQLLNRTTWEGPVYTYGTYRVGEEYMWDEPATTRFSGWHPLKPHDVTPYWEIFKLFAF